eukprot:COSAG05_NODE_19_length_34900_cov_72.237464_11_plen_122_part_00
MFLRYLLPRAVAFSQHKLEISGQLLDVLRVIFVEATDGSGDVGGGSKDEQNVERAGSLCRIVGVVIILRMLRDPDAGTLDRNRIYITTFQDLLVRVIPPIGSCLAFRNLFIAIGCRGCCRT